MEDVIVLGIGGLVVSLILTVLSLLWYTGLFGNVEVQTGKPSFQTLKIAYKYATGPYKECGQLFNEICSLAPNLQTCGIYYDDPNVVEPSQLRYIAAAILAEGHGRINEETETRLLENGYKNFELPAIDYGVKASFPYIWDLSIQIAVKKVYPKLAQYTKERQLSAHPALEIYRPGTIEFVMPLSKQEAFYVPEASPAESNEEDTPEATDEKENQDTPEATDGKEKQPEAVTTGEGEKKKEDSGDDSGSSFEKVEAPEQ